MFFPFVYFLWPCEQKLAGGGLHVQAHVGICMDGNSALQNSVFAKQTWAGLIWNMVRTTEAPNIPYHRGKSTRVSVFQYGEIHLMFMELFGCSWSALEAREMLCWRWSAAGGLWSALLEDRGAF